MVVSESGVLMVPQWSDTEDCLKGRFILNKENLCIKKNKMEKNAPPKSHYNHH